MRNRLKFILSYLKGNRYYTGIVHGYGNRKPIKLNCVAKSKEDADKIFMDYMKETFGTAFIVSRVEISVDKWKRFEV